MAKDSIYRVLVLPDIHCRQKAGGEDKRSLAAVINYIKDEPFDEIVQLGDFLDLDCISRHNTENLRAIENQTLAQDYEVGRNLLDQFLAAQRKHDKAAKFTLLEGNHDYRPIALADKIPQLAGQVEVPFGLGLRERGIKWVPYWSKGALHKIGKAVFLHGRYIADHHAKRHVLYYGANTFYGHVHDVQSYSHVLHGDDSTLVGQSLGCLCELQQAYMRGAPTRWQQAFGVFHFLPNGFFNYSVVRIFHHRFISPAGKVYSY